MCGVMSVRALLIIRTLTASSNAACSALAESNLVCIVCHDIDNNSGVAQAWFVSITHRRRRPVAQGREGVRVEGGRAYCTVLYLQSVLVV